MKISRSNYLYNSSCCPNCESRDICAEQMQIDSGIAWQSVQCDGCGIAWIDEYTLTGIREVYDIETNENIEVID